MQHDGRGPEFSDLCVNSKATMVSVLLDAGWLLVFDGTKPQTADEAVSTQTLLVKVRLRSPAFDPPEGGVMRLRPVDSAVVLASGHPRWFRCETSTHETVFDGTCGVQPFFDYDMRVDADELEAEGEFVLREFIYREAKR